MNCYQNLIKIRKVSSAAGKTFIGAVLYISLQTVPQTFIHIKFCVLFLTASLLIWSLTSYLVLFSHTPSNQHELHFSHQTTDKQTVNKLTSKSRPRPAPRKRSTFSVTLATSSLYLLFSLSMSCLTISEPFSFLCLFGDLEGWKSSTFLSNCDNISSNTYERIVTEHVTMEDRDDWCKVISNII